MNRMKLIALAIALVAAPAVGHAQQRDTVKRDTVKKESTAEKVGRQTGTSVDKAAKTTEHNAKAAGHATKTNASHAASATKTNASHAASATKTNASHAANATKTNASHAASATKTNASHAAKATETNLHHLKKDVKKATASRTRPNPRSRSSCLRFAFDEGLLMVSGNERPGGSHAKDSCTCARAGCVARRVHARNDGRIVRRRGRDGDARQREFASRPARSSP